MERESMTRLQRRDLRELERKIAASCREVAKFYAESKFRREISYGLARSSKQALHHDLLFGDELESQSGLLLGAIAAASGATIANAAHTAASDLKRGVDTLVDISKRLETPVGEACESINGIASRMNNVKSPFEMVGEYLRKSLDDLKSKLLQWWKPVCALIFIGLFIAYSSIAWLGTVVSTLFASMFPDLFSRVARFFESSEIESQGAIDLAAYAATVGCCAFVPSRDPAIMVGEIMKRVGGADRSISGFSTIIEKGIAYLEKVVNAILSMFSEKEVKWTSQLDRVLSKWSTKVDDFERICISRNPTMAELNQAMVLMQEGVGLRQTVKSHANSVFLSKYMDRLGGAIAAHRGAISAENAFRMQPITAMLGGASGVGKTTVLKWLAASVMLLTEAVPHDEILNNMWQKGLSEYWNGYVQQFCYVMDDCFQQKTDGSQLDNEAMFLIRAVGNWAFPLNFADLDSKGRFYFSSPLVLGTTNVSNIKDYVSNLVAEPSAVVRRIQYGYWVFVDPAFQKGSGPYPTALDYAKVEEYYRSKVNALQAPFTREQLLDCIPWHAWQLSPHDFSGCAPPSPCVGGVSLLDLVKEMSAEYTKRMNVHTQEVSDLKSWSEKLASGLKSQSGSDVTGEIFHHELLDLMKNVKENMTIDGQDFSPCLEGMFEYEQTQEPSTPSSSTMSAEELEEIIYQARVEREESYKRRSSWLSDAVRGISRFLSTKIPFLKDFISFVADPWIEHNPHVTTIRTWIRRIRSLGIISMIFTGLVLVVRGAVELTKFVLEKILGTRTQSNTTPLTAKTTKNDIVLPRIVSQSGGPEDVTVDLVYNNTYKVLLCTPNQPINVLGQLLFIEGNLAVMPFHFWRDITAEKGKEAVVTLVSVYNNSVTQSIPVESFLKMQVCPLKESDVIFMKFDNRMLKCHRTITNRFMHEERLKGLFKNTRNNVRLDVAKIDENLKTSRATYVSGVCEYVPTGVPVKDLGEVQGLCKYTAPTSAGDCGAPLSLFDPRYYGGSGLIGIHVAGKSNLLSRSGYATVISRELIYEARSNLDTYTDSFVFGMKYDNMVNVGVLSKDEEQMLAQAGIVAGSFLPIGIVDQPVNIATKSKIKKSPIQDAQIFGPSPTAPAILYPKKVGDETVYPMARAMEAYQSPAEFREIENLDAIVEMATKPFFEQTTGYDKSILTFEDAVAPPPHLKLKPINRKTSPGYPFKLWEPEYPGKTAYFGKEGEYQTPENNEHCEYLRDRVEKMIDQCRRGDRPAVVCMDFLKDELRPLKKVENIATRAISGSPLDYVIAVRMYFGCFLAAMFASCVESGLAPGINPYTDWHVLAEKLTAKGGKVFAGDFSRFDASEQAYILYAILGVVNRWYRENNPAWKPEDDKIREMLWLDLVHSRHLTGVGNKLEYIVQWNKSLPSGHPLTTMVNSFYSLITLTACYAHLTGDFKDMWDHVFINTFGDDNVNGADDSTIEKFNQVTVSKAMKELFNLTYTSDKKDSELVPYETIDQITFLKRSFVRDDAANGGWVAPLDPNSFLYTSYWFKNPKDVRTDLYRNVEQTLSELSLHEPKKWDEFYPAIEKFSLAEGLQIPFRTREAAYQWVQSRNDAWY